MEQNGEHIVNDCNFASVQPALMDLPYPPLQVREKNREYADLLSNDYCGSVSELSAITQYINNENRMSAQQCPMAKTILGIAMAEMIHLQKLGQLIFLLGGDVDFMARQQNGKQKMWTPACLTIPQNERKMIWADIDAERAAINQYKVHINRIGDDYVNAILMRIIRDEEYHIMMLQALLDN
ncbi:MAG: ferritin family protein [Acetatifactor sp.]